MKERYESYKDSGVPWIGQVPQGWEVRRIKSCISIKTDKGSPTATSSYVGMENIVSWDMKYVPTNIEVEGQASFFNTGDILFGKLRPYLAKVWKCEFDGSCSTEFLVMQTDECADFIKYLLVSKPFIDVVNSSTYGAKMPRANSDFIKGLYIPLPPLPIQRAIAGYLDERCAAIDAYVASLEREAGLARELKQAVIARAVTRGLDPNTPMCDSGIPWIGKVPQWWEVDELGRHFRERRTKVSDKEYEPLSVSKHGITPQLETACKTDNGDNRKLVCKGDFVVNSRSDRKGSCGLSDYNGSVSLINTVLEPIDMDGKYCHYLFRSNDYVEEFYRLGRGIVADLWTTRYDDMKVLKIPLPPLPVQRAIAGYLDARCAAIDAYVLSLEREASLARELKQREIADAVTGKVKITG